MIATYSDEARHTCSSIQPSFTFPSPRLPSKVHHSVTETCRLSESATDLACVYSPIVVSDRSSERGGILP